MAAICSTLPSVPIPVTLANLFVLVPPEIFILSPSLNPAVSNLNPVPVDKVIVVEELKLMWTLVIYPKILHLVLSSYL